MNMPLRAVSLDLDNTLWDTTPVLARAEDTLRDWLRARYPAIPAQFDVSDLTRLRTVVAAEFPLRAHDFSWIRTEALRRAARTVGYPDEVAEEAFEVFIAARNDIEPYAEVRPALARLASRLPVYALTNGNACVRRVGLGAHFSGSVDPVVAGVAKPHPGIFEHLLELAGVPAGAVLHVGDDAHADVDGARGAGLRTVWMNRIGAPWPAALARADHEVLDMDELVALVDQLCGAP
jgi:FMN hydrolase / 5-amino-6-(5-phospho-D-ribitylamino)uracil phosphatase